MSQMADVLMSTICHAFEAEKLCKPIKRAKPKNKVNKNDLFIIIIIKFVFI
jgi:hypothetical protein